jgi:hypothetical protein
MEVNMIPQRSEAFDRIIADYLQQVAGLDLTGRADRLGIAAEGRQAMIPFFGFTHRVTPEGIFGPGGRPASHAVSVILFKYLLLCPEQAPRGEDWVTYRDFKDAAPFVEGFLNTAERPIARDFAGRCGELETACRRLGGQSAPLDITADLVVRFAALPKLPLVLVFNDRDDDFPAACTLLFQRSALGYLDMECLAMCGMVLARWLRRHDADPPPWESVEGLL